MTTIIYDHKNKQVSCDSREVAGNMICSDNVLKHFELNGDVWFCAGSASDGKVFAQSAKHNTVSPEYSDCTAIMIRGKKAHIVAVDDEGVYKIQELEMSEGIGSGGRFALSAIDFDKTAKEAVEYAMTRDVYTGGKVHVYDIGKGEFI